MKKFASILLSLVLVGMSLQPALALHYCRGELAGVKLVAGYGTASCGMMPHQDPSHENPQQLHAAACCQDELQQGTTDEFTSSVPQILNLNPVASFVQVPTNMGAPVSFFASRKDHFPPPLPDITAVSLPVISVFII